MHEPDCSFESDHVFMRPWSVLQGKDYNMERTMKRVQLLIFLTVGFGMGILGSGCGGGGGDDDDDGGGNRAAPQDLRSHSIRINPANEPAQVIFFEADATHFRQFEAGTTNTVRTGTYIYTPTGSTAELRLTDESNNLFEEITITLNFTSASSGSFTSVSTTGETQSGTFSNLRRTDGGSAGDGSGGDGTGDGAGDGSGDGTGDGGNDGDGTGDDGGGGGGGGAGALDGRVMTLTRSPGGQTHIYTFTGTKFVDEDPGTEKAEGSYTYTRTGSQAHLTLNYERTLYPPGLDHSGDRHEVDMVFETEDRGTYSGTYFRNDGANLAQSGSFQFIE